MQFLDTLVLTHSLVPSPFSLPMPFQPQPMLLHPTLSVPSTSSPYIPVITAALPLCLHQCQLYCHLSTLLPENSRYLASTRSVAPTALPPSPWSLSSVTIANYPTSASTLVVSSHRCHCPHHVTFTTIATSAPITTTPIRINRENSAAASSLNIVLATTPTAAPVVTSTSTAIASVST